MMKSGRKRSASVYVNKPFKKPRAVVMLNRPSAGFVRNRNTRAMRREKKVIDVNYASYAVETTGTQLLLLNGCAPGSQNYNRDGRKITMKSLQIHGHINTTDANCGPGIVRMVIVYDKQTNGSAPTWGDVFTSQNTAGTTSTGAYAMVNLNNRDRFEIIRDKVIAMGVIRDTATQTYASGPVNVKVDKYIKLGNRTTTFNAGQNGTVGDITTGSLYLFFISNLANAEGYTAYISTRLRFVDE